MHTTSQLFCDQSQEPAPAVVEEPVANPEADLKNDLEAIKKVIKR